jgi:hypothetical protein
VSPGGVGGALSTSAGMACRTVAMLHYRPDAFDEHQSAAGLSNPSVAAAPMYLDEAHNRIECFMFYRLVE